MSDDTGIYEPGTVIDGRYRIESRLGRGGFATVYRAQHLQLDRPAALKVLEPVASFISERFYARFETEARIAANLDHPNVVRIFDYGMIEPENRPYIAMQMLDGRDLEEHLLLKGTMAPTRAKELFEGVLDALRLGHERGIVHKDLKPSNLYMVAPDTPDERLVVLDYGIAWLEGDENPRYTEEGQYTGTPAYMPPEYIRERLVTPAFDVYQIGLIFIEAMTGQPVVVGRSNIEYMVAHTEGRHRIPDGFGDTPLGATLLKAISVDPNDRYHDAGEMLDAVRIARVDSGTDYTLPAITEEDIPAHLRPTEESPKSTPKKKSNRGLILAAVALGGLLLATFAVIAIGVGIFWYASTQDDTRPTPTTPAKPSVSSPSIPSMPNTDFVMPSRVRGGDEIFGLVLARYMVAATMYQVKIFEDSVKRSRGNPAHIFAPTGTQQMLDVAYQQMEKGAEAHGEQVQARVESLIRELRELEVLLVDLHDYYSIQKGYEDDDGERGKQLQKKIRQQLKRVKPKFVRYENAVSKALERYLEDRAETYDDGEAPFLMHATEVMQAAQKTIELTARSPKSKRAAESLEELEKATGTLQDYVRDHAGELGDRYSQTAGTHNQFLQTNKDTYKKAREIQKKARRGQDYDGDLQFLQMQLHSTLQTYNVLTMY